MSISNKSKYTAIFVIGILMIVVAYAISLHNVDSRLVGVIISLGLYLAVLSILRFLRFGNSVETDERTMRVSAFATYYTFILAVVAMGTIYVMVYLNYLTITVMQLIYAVIFLLCIPYIVFYFYFNMKGDVR